MDAPSRTALGVALLRALHRIVDAEPWVVDDPVSMALFGDAARKMLQHDSGWATDEGRAALRGHVLVRSAFAEERLYAAVARGVGQVVILGAGYDTFAYRQPGGFEDVRVFEVDAPPTQAHKRELLARGAVPVPANVQFAPIDFERSTLGDGLRAAGFDAARPAFFSWLGVMVYLTRDAADGVLRFVGSLPHGSEIVFTFSLPGPDSALTRRVAEAGEPLRTRVTRAELDGMVRAAGFRELTVLSQAEAARYLGERVDDLRLPPRESIASARV